MATTEPGIRTPPSPSEVGRHLRAVRKSKGLSRSEVARSAGLTRRELAAYERGRSPVPDSDLWCLAGSCGVDVGDLLPNPDRLGVGSDLGALTVGESVRRLRPGRGNDGVLREYLAMVYELRNLPPGTKPPMRDEDLATLADALGGSPDAIEARLHDLIGASRDEAARLRAMILPPRPIAAGASLAAPVAVTVGGAPSAPGDFGPTDTPWPIAAPVAVAVGATTSALGDGWVTDEASMPAYPPPTFDFATAAPSIGDADAADRFFASPHATDPFAAPPPPEPLAPMAGFGAADTTPPPAVIHPFAAPTAAQVAAYAPPTGPPLAPARDHDTLPGSSADPTDEVDPFGLEAGAWAESTPPSDSPRPDGFVADFGSDTPVVAAWGVDPTTDVEPVADPFGAAEMVVLDVAPDGTVVGDPVGFGADGVAYDTVDTVDLGDDPFAVLRVPIEDLAPDLAFAAADDAWLEDVATDVVAGPEDLAAPITTEPVVEPDGLDAPDIPEADAEALPVDSVLAGDDDPTDEWFDRAAAAADALIAEQLVAPEIEDLSAVDPEPEPAADAEPEPIVATAPEPAVDREPEPIVATAEPAVDPEPVTGGHVAATIEPEPELLPIAWSLPPSTPAAATPTVAPVAPAPTDDFVVAGTDWQVGGIFPATAMADDGTLALRRADVRWALADLVTRGDFTVRATVNFTSGAGFGILFRVSTDDAERITGYSFDVDPIYSGGGFLVRQWNDSRQHWKPLAHAPVADTARLYGAHVIEVSLRDDELVARIDGEAVMTVAELSRCSIDAGHEPCRGDRLGVQAWSTTEVTVDRLMLAHR